MIQITKQVRVKESLNYRKMKESIYISEDEVNKL